jgi:hypothetical protein
MDQSRGEHGRVCAKHNSNLLADFDVFILFKKGEWKWSEIHRHQSMVREGAAIP